MSGVRLPNRRGVIRGLAGLALGGALAGCFEQRPNEAYRIGRLEGVNRTTNPHDVGIRISVGDETVYEKIHRIGPDSEDSGSGGFVVDTDLPDSNRPYQVEAKLDAGDWKTTLAPGARRYVVCRPPLPDRDHGREQRGDTVRVRVWLRERTLIRRCRALSLSDELVRGPSRQPGHP